MAVKMRIKNLLKNFGRNPTAHFIAADSIWQLPQVYGVIAALFLSEKEKLVHRSVTQKRN